MTERHPKICLISPTEDLARRAKKLVARRGMDVRVEVAELEAAVSWPAAFWRKMIICLSADGAPGTFCARV
ncbi:MAG: hypothetical protein ACLSAF_08040 [Intestinimonas sp.]